MKDYKKILKGVVNIIVTTEKTDIGFANICSYLNDNYELFESKDERIRKELISLVQYTKGRRIGYEPRISQDEMIAWLEELGKQQPIWTDNDRIMAFTLLRDVDQMTYISNEGKNERLEWLNSLEDKFSKGE